MAEPSYSAPAASVATRCRALVMLVCLVALPLAALRGTAWSDLTNTIPKIVKKIFDGRWGSSAVLAKDAGLEAPVFRRPNEIDPREVRQGPPPPSRDDASVGARRDRRAVTPPAEIGRLPHPAIQNDAPAEAQPSEETATPGRSPVRAGLRVRGIETPDIRHTPLVPVARRERAWGTPAGPDSPPLQNAVIRPRATPGQTDRPADRLTYVLERLRELGAVYYLLETWGNDAQRFRFHCKMAIGGNPNYTRHFEATDREAIQAMGKVLAEVESWRADR